MQVCDSCAADEYEEAACVTDSDTLESDFAFVADHASDGVTVVGEWATEESEEAFGDFDFLSDSDSDKGSKSVVFSVSPEQPGFFEITMLNIPGDDRSTSTPVTINGADGAVVLTVDQSVESTIVLGIFRLNATSSVVVETTDTDVNTVSEFGTLVVVDAIRFVPIGLETVCRACEPCDDGFYVVSECTATAAAECDPHSVCADDEYETAAPTSTTDRECSALTECNDDEYETTAPTATTDRLCANTTICDDVSICLLYTSPSPRDA